MFRLLALSSLLIPTAVSAQDDPFRWLNYETVNRCTPDSDLYISYLEKYHGETLLFLGESAMMNSDFQVDKGTLGFFVNQKTGTYTVTILFDDGVICEISIGENFTPR
jgi:hypothetical protein